jgi:hypothetical protein
MTFSIPEVAVEVRYRAPLENRQSLPLLRRKLRREVAKALAAFKTMAPERLPSGCEALVNTVSVLQNERSEPRR